MGEQQVVPTVCVDAAELDISGAPACAAVPLSPCHGHCEGRSKRGLRGAQVDGPPPWSQRGSAQRPG